MKPLSKAKPPLKKSSLRVYQAEKHLRRFCNITSQELGNILAAIVGELDYALTHRKTKARNTSMRVALTAAERAMNLTRNLQYFAVHTRLDVQNADVSQILLDTIDLVETELKARGVQLSVLAEASAHAPVDVSAVQQVVLNLISNANHAMPQGGKITVSLRRVRQSLEITISDTGVGIAPENLDKVFEPYSFSGNLLFESQGLGLAVVKALVEAHGGEISVESHVGHGSTFSLYFPSTTELSQPTPFAEKRRFRRVNITLPVEVSMEGQVPFFTELSILSVGGCFIQIPSQEILKRVERDKSLSLRILFFKNEEIKIREARIATVCRIGSNLGVGVEFLQTDTKAQKILAALVKSRPS